MFFSTPTLSKDELNFTFNFKAYALPFNPVTSFGLYFVNSGIYQPVEPGSYFQLSSMIIPYKLVLLLPVFDFEYTS